MFRRLVAYQAQHGNCNVPTGYSDQQLGGWVTAQRMAKKRGKLSPERERRLTDTGFVWDMMAEAWEEMFLRLVSYKDRYGHCNVPQNYRDKKLAFWVAVQRQSNKRGELSPARERRLTDIGFVWRPLRGRRGEHS